MVICCEQKDLDNVGFLEIARQEKQNDDFSFQRSSSSKNAIDCDPDEEIEPRNLEKHEFRHPAKSNIIARFSMRLSTNEVLQLKYFRN